MIYYQHDGFIFRHPAPDSLANIAKLEVWTAELGWQPVRDAETRAEATWFGMELDRLPDWVQESQ